MNDTTTNLQPRRTMDTEIITRIRAILDNGEEISCEGARRLLAAYDRLGKSHSELTEQNKRLRAQLYGWKGLWETYHSDDEDNMDSGLLGGTIQILASTAPGSARQLYEANAEGETRRPSAPHSP